MKAIEMAGLRYGHLLVLRRAPSGRNGRAWWLCKCDCGTEKAVESQALRAGRVVSCGCFRAHVLRTSGVKHGQHGTGAWNTWADMMKRCTNPRSVAYRHYGGRGISVCEAWQTFEGFFADMGQRPEGMTLERKDVNGNYEPSNCVWLPAPEQVNNRRVTVRVSVGGQQMALSEACRHLGLSYSRTRERMKRLGWSFEQAIAEPKKVNGTMYATEDRRAHV